MNSPVASRTSASQPHVGSTHLRVVAGGSEEDIVDLVHRHADGAAEKLYDRFATDIHRIVWKVLGADPDHDDIVHEIFIAVWIGLQRGRLDQRERLASWVMGIAMNTLRKELRRRRFRHQLAIEATERFGPDVIEHDPGAREVLRAFYRTASQLPAEEHLLITLRHVDGRTLPEIATLCACSLSTAKRRLRRAEQRFRRISEREPAILRLLSGSTQEERP